MQDKKYYLFAWKSYDDCGGSGCFPAWAESLSELCVNSFYSIEDAQRHFENNRNNADVAEIVTVQDGEMCIVATLDDSGVAWTTKTRQIGDLPSVEVEPEPELTMVMNKAIQRNRIIEEQVK